MIFFLALLMAITYVSAIFIEKYRQNRKGKIAYFAALLVVLSILIGLKYINFFIYTGKSISKFFRIDCPWTTVNVVAPLGISFFSLQLIGYLIDVQRGVVRAQKNLLQYSLFATFFPQLTSGPINRCGDLEDQFAKVRKFDYKELTFGLQRIMWGFFKKLVISERMAVVVNIVYSDYATYSGLYIIIATICFAFQLYTDFSGYTDIALGTAQALGIRLAENFQTPFFSHTISEYWRRWHITLGNWFKDYLFYPVLKSEFLMRIGNFTRKQFGKNSGKKAPTYIGMFILWFCVGMWHGGSWNYIFGSGLLHWMYIVGGQLLEPTFKKIIHKLHINIKSLWYRRFQIIRTFLLVCIGFVFFRAESFTQGLDILKSVFTLNMNLTGIMSIVEALGQKDLLIGILSLIVLFVISLLKEKMSIRETIAKQNLFIRWGIYYLLIFSVLIFGFYGPDYSVSEFIYENF